MARGQGGVCARLPVLADAESVLAGGSGVREMDGDSRATRRWFEAAYRDGERRNDGQVMAKALAGLGGLWVHEHRTAVASGRLRARQRHVLTLIDPGCDLAVRLRARLAAHADFCAGEYSAVLAVLDEARASSDPVVRAEALSLAHECLLGPEHGELRRGLADEMVGQGALAGRRQDLLMGLLWQVVDLFRDADRHAERRLGELRGLLGEDGHSPIGRVVEAIDVMLAVRAGRFDEAEVCAGKYFERGMRPGDANAAERHAAQLVAIRLYQGRLPELIPMLSGLVDSPGLSAVDSVPLAMLALAAATAGDCLTAESALARLGGRALADLPRSGTWLVTMYGVVEAAYLLGNARAAARAYRMLQPHADLPIMTGCGAACFGSVHHALGVACLTMGDADRAVRHFREAVHRNLALGHWPAVLASRLRCAEALSRRGRPGDEHLAEERRAAAGKIAVRLGVAAPVGAAAWGAPTGGATCVRDGRRWRIEFGARAVHVEHSVGVTHLVVLIANPGVEIAAIDLVAGLDATRGAASLGEASVQPILDRAGVTRYRQRLVELRDEIDDLVFRGDRAGATRARSEREWVLTELSAATGLGGRVRAFSDDKERARLAVGRAIRRAIARVEQADAVIGAHLRGGVHTGTVCWYRP